MDVDRARERLQEEQSRLEQMRSELDEVTEESEEASLGELSVADQHPGDVGTETFHREVDLSILEQVEAELADVEHAMRRIDEGTYGTCEACGKPIGDDRLEAVPMARFCVEDQAAAEREARTASGSE